MVVENIIFDQKDILKNKQMKHSRMNIHKRKSIK